MAQYNRQQQALQIVQEVCAVLGLPVPTLGITSPVDVTARQIIALLRSVGRRLCKPTDGHRWQVLQRTWTLTTVPGITQYPLPADWDSFEDLTGWNTSTTFPLVGPATSPQWHALQARTLGGVTITVIYRTSAGKFELSNPYSDPQTLTIGYTSRAWVQDENDPLLFKDAPEKDGDIVLFDADLMIAGVKLAFLTNKGFDTTAAQGEYNELLESAMNADQDAPILTCGQQPGAPLLNPWFNVPDTGYGI